MTAPAANPSNAEPKDPSEVGIFFAHEYYTFLNKEPTRLHLFYNKDSTMSHGVQGEPTTVSHGQQDINARFRELDFEDCKVLVSNIDAQNSVDGGIMIQVIGEMSNREGPAQKFAQTFFLAEQPQGYYVLNDIFRYLKDEEDSQVYTETADQVTEATGEHSTLNVETAKSVERDAVEESFVIVIPDEPELAETENVVTKAGVEEEKRVTVPVLEADKPEDKKNAKQDKQAVEKQEIAKPKVEDVAAAHPEAPVETASAPAQAAPAQPPKPKTWANLAASNPTQWGPHVAPAKAATAAAPQATPKPSTPQAAQSQTQPSQSGNRPQGGPKPREEYHSIYIKNVTERMSVPQLREAFSKFGTVKHLELTQKRTCAFLDFSTPDAMHAALKQNTVPVGNEVVLAEERRRNTNNQNNANAGQNAGRPYNPSHHNTSNNASTVNGHGHGQQQQQQGGAARGGRGNSARKPSQNRTDKPAQSVVVK
ncbi:hypothetical protein BGZ98_009159 [Dissophora globulifera]|nr:hypothetical protein BGZ98_009159 [Dissophora globulifera]